MKYLREKVKKKEGKNLKDVDDEYRDWIEILKVIRHRPKYYEGLISRSLKNTEAKA